VPDLSINNVVIHALNKEQHKSIQPSTIRKKVLDREHDAVVKTVTGLVSIYGTRNNSAHYGIVQTDEGRGPFPDKFEEYTRFTSPSEAQFLELTTVAMKKLYGNAQVNHAASGGCILFADYTNHQGRYFLVAMVKQKPGITLTEQLEPAELMQLDLSKLNQAARISFSRLAAYLAAPEDERMELSYLSFISPSSTKTASGYFVTALGCSAGAASAQATKTLIREARKFFNENNDLRPLRDVFNNALMDYLKDKEETRESVKLSEIEHIVKRHIPDHLAESAETIVDKLITHLNSEECSVPTEFPVSSSALKRFTHISGKSNSWKMIFDRLALGTDESAEIYYDSETNKLTLRNVPVKMREQIEEELENRNKE